ncbi:hypothetical protein [Nocardioides nitrophenolicus]|uniref:hypothetical protein n=1 Tax=Nocardioides nitrophenolicus TaxID=60489 RepID=UPI001958A2D8|nr:hypothetical protein [Nocardioides nitrophenolicus]MBM7516327.1 hypothetical protein [Nocardioides nitrophenolicus]
MGRTTIAGLVAALLLVLIPAAVAPAGAAARADRGWTTVHQRVGAKIQVCQRRENWGWGLQMRLDARKARKSVKARVRVQYLAQGIWDTFPGSSSAWRRRGIDELQNFGSGSKTSVQIKVRIRTRSEKPPLTDWIDVSNPKRCP